MDKSSRLEKQWYSYWSKYGEHQYINELGHAYFDEGYADTLEKGFEKSEDYLKTQLKYD